MDSPARPMDVIGPTYTALGSRVAPRELLALEGDRKKSKGDSLEKKGEKRGSGQREEKMAGNHTLRRLES